MANRSLAGYLQISGVPMQSTAFSATVSSDWIRADGDWIGVSTAAVVSGGSSPTCDVTIECTPDNGTTVFSLPADNNSQTAAAMTQITATANGLKFWLNPLIGIAGWKWRAKFTAGGTISTFTITAQYFARTTAEELR